MFDDFTSGGISGAITNMQTEEAYIHAVKRYMFFRSIDYDVKNIAKNTGYDEKRIWHIKKYLFYDDMTVNDEGEPVPFDPSFAIASSWDRLAFNPDKIQHHDLLLLEHEMYEMSLYFQGYSQDEAHDLATQKYNYEAEARKYYSNLKRSQKKKHKETPITFNALIRLKQLVKDSLKHLNKQYQKFINQEGR